MKKTGIFFLFAALCGFADQSGAPGEKLAYSLNPPYLPNQHWSLSADFLYWQAQESSLEIATSEKVTFSFLTFAEEFNQKLVPLNFHWDPGFRVSLGYNANQSAWDLFLTYTYMHNTARGSKSVSETPSISGTIETEDLLVPLWSPIFLGVSATTASGKWALNYNILDLAVGRNYLISNHLAIHPYFGLRGAILHQDYTVNYTGIFNGVDTTDGATFSITAPSQFTAKYGYQSAGIRGGTDLLWHLVNHFAILGEASASLLYGNFHVKDRISGQTVFPTLARVTPQTLIDNNKYWRVRPNMEAYVGLQWDTFFGCAKHIALNVGYEISYWFEQNVLTNQMPISLPIEAGPSILTSVGSFEKNSGLGLQGLTANLAFDF